MSEARTCSGCGAVVHSASDGLCPYCLEPLTASEAQSTVRDGNQEAPDPSTLPLFHSLTGAERIGHYKLLQKIGEGGFGVVYLAEQEQPVKRRVALKVIKLGMDTRQVVARFEAERQALALMDHPNIAKVLDGGATEAGRPYFVMELVKGIKITQYCDQNRVGLKERLDLFLQVCHAIQHAHQKGIIHRDIKPSNILVSMHDGVPVPKVIDFGIAKATEQRLLTDKTLFTAYDQFMGTPAYMSPEQAEMSVLDIDTRSDIYSLGVLLYELLTGRTPFENEALMQRGIEEARRAIREEEPPRPSTKLSTLGEGELDTVAKQRAAEAPKLLSSVRGDLDWIVMKCLEKDRTRRYETANGLGMDVKRFLDQEPIIARPPSNIYRFQKLVRRNKAAFAAAAVVFVALTIGLGVATWSLVRERAARSEANFRRIQAENRRLEAEEARTRERTERQRAQANATRMEFLVAENLFEKDKAAEGLAYLARILRREPTNRVAAERILSALSFRNFSRRLARIKHHAEIVSAQFSPDGRQVLTASQDHTACIWDSCSGRLISEFQHTNQVLTAEFSPDAKYVLTASGDQSARIWEVATARVVFELRHDAPVLSATYSPDGRKIATGGEDRRVRAWDSATGQILAGPFVVSAPADLVQFSAGGKLIAVMTLARNSNATALALPGFTSPSWVLDADTGAEVASFPGSVTLSQRARPLSLPYFSRETDEAFAKDAGGGSNPEATVWKLHSKPDRTVSVMVPKMIHCLALSPDGTLAAAASQDNAAYLWERQTGKAVFGPLRHQDWVNSVRFSPDGQKLATGSKDNTARLWDVANGDALTEPLQHESALLSVQFSHDGQRLLTVCSDYSASVWDLRSVQALASPLQHPWYVRMAVFNAGGQHIATASAYAKVRLWSASAGDLVTELSSVDGGSEPRDLQFSLDGRWVAVTSMGSARGVHLWDTTGRNRPVVFRHAGFVQSIRFDPTGEYLVTAGSETNALVWNLSTGTIVSRLPHRAESHFTRFSPDGNYVLTASRDKTAQIWDWRTGQPRFPQALHHDDAVVCADISSDGRLIATLSLDKTARIWDAHTGQMRGPPLAHTEEPYEYHSIQFSPDGHRLATAAGNSLQIWDVATGRPITAVLKHDRRINSVRFSPDGRRIATACTDGAARIWDAETGYVLGEAYKHKERVNYAEFSPDGRWLVTASDDSTARIWEVPQLRQQPPPWLAELAEAVAGQRLLEGNINEIVPFETSVRVRESLRNSSLDGELKPWAEWFFDTNETRTISLSSAITVSEYVTRRIRDNTTTSLREAVRLCPTNGVAQAKLAFAELTNRVDDPRQKTLSDWQSWRAATLQPNDPDAWWLRAQVCEYLGRLTDALAAMERASRLAPTNPAFWNAWGLMLEKTNHIEGALQAYTDSVELSPSWSEPQTFPAIAWKNRSNLLKRLGRLIEAAADNIKSLNISDRDPASPSNLLDLALFYNLRLDQYPAGHRHAIEMPIGRRVFDNVEFDVRGIVQLAGTANVVLRTFPAALHDIQVNQKCRRLHFLHATRYSVPDGTHVAEYVLHYTTGEKQSLQLVYGEHLRDWNLRNDPAPIGKQGAVAWSGQTATFAARLFKTTWDNPQPHIPVAKIDFVSNNTQSAPFLIAITADPYLERQ